MAKPTKGNDATQELTMDQLVSSLPPKLPPPSKNDVSLWGRFVVGAEEFTPGAGVKRRIRWGVIALVLGTLVTLSVVVYVVVLAPSGGSSSDESKAAAPATE